MLPDFQNPERPTLQDPLELRAAPRVGCDLAASIYTTEFPGPLAARLRDISTGGACLASPSPFASKAIQRVALSLPRGTLSLDARGTWQRDADADDMIFTGVCFIDLPEEAAEQLWDLVFDRGKAVARFLCEKSELFELGVEEGLGLAQVSRYRDVPAGRCIYREDSVAEGSGSLFILLEGTVGLHVRVRNALETEVERLGPGELFGGTPLVAGVPPAESALAITNSRLLEIDEQAFRYLRMAKPWLGYRLGQTVIRVNAARLRALTTRLKDEL
jgi:hypothetical protein